MSPSTESLVQRRRLCHELRALRATAGSTQEQVAAALEFSVSKMVRIESGQVGISASDLAILLNLYGVSDPQTRDRLLTMARAARNPQWSSFRDVLTVRDLTYLGSEASATRLRHYDATLVPELLRTEPYAWAVIQALSLPGTPVRMMRRQLEVCLTRQALLDTARTEARFLIEESALRRGTDVYATILQDQLHRLQELADRPHVTIRVLPWRQRIHFGVGGSFVLLNGDDVDSHSVYLLGPRDTPTLTPIREASRYRAAFDDLSEASQSLASWCETNLP